MAPNPPIRRALVGLPWSTDRLERLTQLLAPAEVVVVGPHDRKAIVRELATADAALLMTNPGPPLLDAPNLRWLHVDHGGFDTFAPPELFERDLIVTTSAGRSESALADHTIFLLLAVTHDLATISRLRRRRAWTSKPLHGRQGLTGRHLVVVGCGSTGRAVAVRARAMGMRVTGVRRSAGDLSEFDHIVHDPTPDEFRRLLAETDALVLASSLNDATHHLIGATELAAMPDHAIVVNIARGALIDEEALVDALRDGGILGAGLDVATHEPLRPTSPLWRLDNVVLTPHIGPSQDDRAERSLAIVAEIIASISAGDEVERRLTSADAYTRREPRRRSERFLSKVWAKLNGIWLSRR